MTRNTALVAVLLMGCAEQGGIEAPENASFCESCSHVAQIVVQSCHQDEAFAPMEEDVLKARVQVAYWFIQEYSADWATLQSLQLTCESLVTDGYDGTGAASVDCDDYAACLTDEGVSLPSAWPSFETLPTVDDEYVESECGVHTYVELPEEAD